MSLGDGERPLAAFGEVGLTGELRYVAHPERRMAEAAKFGLAARDGAGRRGQDAEAGVATGARGRSGLSQRRPEPGTADVCGPAPTPTTASQKLQIRLTTRWASRKSQPVRSA